MFNEAKTWSAAPAAVPSLGDGTKSLLPIFRAAPYTDTLGTSYTSNTLTEIISATSEPSLKLDAKLAAYNTQINDSRTVQKWSGSTLEMPLSQNTDKVIAYAVSFRPRLHAPLAGQRDSRENWTPGIKGEILMNLCSGRPPSPNPHDIGPVST
ncbi:hypothetical protein EVAR_9154_1 [Eumeta japonica]|uniref:Uncharacterized protein n=1 Tax=Eumeta variegata TaxID=151549 RepID=A0A4C1TWK5_EUMVA|nr:hypothetical protein EVAR_9154_1 [Eumeta japonica]